MGGGEGEFRRRNPFLLHICFVPTPRSSNKNFIQLFSLEFGCVRILPPFFPTNPTNPITVAVNPITGLPQTTWRWSLFGEWTCQDIGKASEELCALRWNSILAASLPCRVVSNYPMSWCGFLANFAAFSSFCSSFIRLVLSEKTSTGKYTFSSSSVHRRFESLNHCLGDFWSFELSHCHIRLFFLVWIWASESVWKYFHQNRLELLAALERHGWRQRAQHLRVWGTESSESFYQQDGQPLSSSTWPVVLLQIWEGRRAFFSYSMFNLGLTS